MIDLRDSMMTLFEVLGLRFFRRIASVRVCAIWVCMAFAWCCIVGTVSAENKQAIPVPKVANAPLSVSKIDFKRGDDGSGRLILKFDGQGATPDLRTLGWHRAG